MRTKLFSAIILTVILIFNNTFIFASEIGTVDSINKSTIIASYKDSISNDVVYIDSSNITLETRTITPRSSKDGVIEIISESYTVDINIPIEDIGNKARDSSGSSSYEACVTSNLNIEYSKNSKGQYKVTKISGSWIPDKYIMLQDREVYGYEGGTRFTSAGMKEYPISNDFSYYTGFGWSNPSIEDYSIIPMYAPGARSYVDARMSGIFSTYEIELVVLCGL